MADINISKFTTQVLRVGSTPSSPGFAVDEGQDPVDPSGNPQTHLPVTIAAAADGLSITDAQVLSGAGTTAQYIRGNGSLATFPSLTGFVPYTGATADVDLGTHDLTAERGTFQNNGSSDTLTVNHTSGSGYGIKVTKGGSNEALLVTKTSGSGNAMTVVGGRTSLVDLALSSVTNTAGDFLTLSGGVVHKRTASEVRTDIGAGTGNGTVTSVAALTLGTSGTDLSSTVANGTTTPVITLNVPTASATNRGALSSADWSLFTQAYNDKINSASVTGTTTKTLTLTQQDGGTITASWTDLNTDAVLSVFGRTGAVVAVSGDYTTAQVTESGNLYYTEARVNANTNVAANTAARHNAVTLGTANGLSLSTQVLSLGLASAGVTGALSGTDWSTFNSKQNALTLTTTGTSGVATLVGSTLNIPQYQAAGTYVTGVTASSPLASSGGTTPNITIQQASGSQNGFLSSTDWTTFNNKQNALTNPVTGSGTTNTVPKFTGSTTIGNSQIIDNGTTVGIGVTPTTNKLEVGGGITIGTGFTNNTDIRFNNATNGKIQYIFSDALSGDLGLEAGASVGIKFNTNGANTRMAIFSDGNVTIGNSPSNAGFKLDVNGTGRFSDNLRISKSSNSGSGSGFPRFTVQNTLATQGDGSSTFNFADINISSGNEAVNMFLATTFAAGTWAPAGIINVATNHELQFKTNNTTRLTLANSGAATFSSSVTATGSIQTNSNLFVTNGSLNFGGTATFTSTDPAIYRVAGNDLVIAIGSTERFRIASTGAATFSNSVTATSFFESSDATLKTLVEDDYQAKGIDSVVAKLYIKNGKQELGYFAQDLESILPSAVIKGSDGLLNLSYREVHTAKIAYLEEEIRQIKKRYEIN